MFDSNNDGALTFDEFTIATSAKENSTIDEKLTWLFEVAFDKVKITIYFINSTQNILLNILYEFQNRTGKIMKTDVHDIMLSLLQVILLIKIHKN